VPLTSGRSVVINKHLHPGAVGPKSIENHRQLENRRQWDPRFFKVIVDVAPQNASLPEDVVLRITDSC